LTYRTILIRQVIVKSEIIMKKITIFLILLMFLSIVGISGCTSSDNSTNTQPTSTNQLNSSTTTSSPSNTKTSPSDGSSSPSNSVDSSSSGSNPASAMYVGSVNSNIFHYPSCSSAKRIKSYNLITFNSREEAIQAGYHPCKICNP